MNLDRRSGVSPKISPLSWIRAGLKTLTERPVLFVPSMVVALASFATSWIDATGSHKAIWLAAPLIVGVLSISKIGDIVFSQSVLTKYRSLPDATLHVLRNPRAYILSAAFALLYAVMFLLSTVCVMFVALTCWRVWAHASPHTRAPHSTLRTWLYVSGGMLLAEWWLTRYALIAPVFAAHQGGVRSTFRVAMSTVRPVKRWLAPVRVLVISLYALLPLGVAHVAYPTRGNEPKIAMLAINLMASIGHSLLIAIEVDLSRSLTERRGEL